MALRTLTGKLSGVLGRQAASGALTRTCEHCGKPSSRIAASLGEKSGAIEDDLSMELRRLRLKHYAIRTTAVTVSVGVSWMIVSTGVDYLEDDEKFDSLVRRRNVNRKK